MDLSLYDVVASNIPWNLSGVPPKKRTNAGPKTKKTSQNHLPPQKGGKKCKEHVPFLRVRG